MSNRVRVEDQLWELDFNEHVTHIPPHLGAEYHITDDDEGISPLRLRLQGATAPYGFEVSAPQPDGAVSLSAVKYFEQDGLLMSEAAPLKTYMPAEIARHPQLYSPQQAALEDARALVYEWGRHDLDHAMGAAFKLAQAHGFTGETLFEQGDNDTFTSPEKARSLTQIQADRQWEQQLENFGTHHHELPLDQHILYSTPIGQCGVDPLVPPGQFYGVALREANLPETQTSLYLVEGFKAWLERDRAEPCLETVTLDAQVDVAQAVKTLDQVTEQPDVPARLNTMAELAHTFARQAVGARLPFDEAGQTPAELFGLSLRSDGLFQSGPPDPLELPHPTQIEMTQPSAMAAYDLHHQRVLSPDAYDVPLEEGQVYAFQARRLLVLEDQLTPYGMDALAVEAVKQWAEQGQVQQQVTTLGIFHDRDDARQEVDTYADLAEREGIQAAMSRAAMLADVQNSPVLVAQAETLDLHINPDVRYSTMFSRGPADPFLAEREIELAAQQYAADHPAHHQLALQVVPVQTPIGEALGHSVMAVDMQWAHEELSHDPVDATGVSAYELAQFKHEHDATEYALHLSEYLGQRDLSPTGTNITPALNFVQTLREVNGLSAQSHWVEPEQAADLLQGNWVLHHEPADFHPTTPLPAHPVLPVISHDLDF